MDRSTCFFEPSDSECVDIWKVFEREKRARKRRDVPHCLQVGKVGRGAITEETKDLYGVELEAMHGNRFTFLTTIRCRLRLR